MKHKITTRRLVSLALMAALSVGLHYLESLIPPFVPIPGFRLGLANIITLFVLYYYGGVSYIFVTVIKVLIVALISTSFGITFFMSLLGSILSILISLFCFYVIRSSIYSVSALGSLFHTLGQLLAYAIFFKTWPIFSYFALLGPISLVTGVLMAVLVSLLIYRIPRRFREEEKVHR